MDDQNTAYKSPKSDLDTNLRLEVPYELLKKIKNGWIAAIISGLLTFGVMLISIYTEALEGLYDIWSMVDVILILVLAFGIYKKSRTASTFMFVYFIVSKILVIVETGRVSGLLLTAVFLYFFYQAMMGTYQYHKLLESHNKSMHSGIQDS